MEGFFSPDVEKEGEAGTEKALGLAGSTVRELGASGGGGQWGRGCH